MVYVIAEHFLNTTGKEYFPKWIQEVKKIVTNFEGFHSLEIVKDVNENEKTILILQFLTIEYLRVWSKSKAHDNSIQLLSQYAIKKLESRILIA